MTKRRDQRRYRQWKSDHCERCGWVPEHLCQLDVDHVVDYAQGGGNDAGNSRTLCASCHRLKNIRPDLFALPAPSVRLTRVPEGTGEGSG